MGTRCRPRGSPAACTSPGRGLPTLACCFPRAKDWVWLRFSGALIIWSDVEWEALMVFTALGPLSCLWFTAEKFLGPEERIEKQLTGCGGYLAKLVSVSTFYDMESALPGTVSCRSSRLQGQGAFRHYTRKQRLITEVCFCYGINDTG